MKQVCVLLMTVTFLLWPSAAFAATQPCTPISLTPAEVANGNFPAAGTYPTQTLTAAPGAAFDFSVTDGILPPGLSLIPAPPTQAEISGTPLANGTFLLTVTATDPSSGCAGGRTFAITIFECGDGTLDPGEDCDDGNLLDTDTCSPTCAKAWCYSLVFDDPAVCYANGSCIAPDVCECWSGYTGPDCSTPVPITCFGIASGDHVVCSANGECIAPDVCECWIGYTGPDCSVPITCFGMAPGDYGVCSDNGTCVAQDTCTCDYGYTGQICETPLLCDGIPALNPTVCNGRGICTGPDVCVCAGSTGMFCETPLCNGILATDPTVCNGRGVCTGPDVCLCTGGYTGPDCGVPP